jgi:hypothetical protein
VLLVLSSPFPSKKQIRKKKKRKQVLRWERRENTTGYHYGDDIHLDSLADNKPLSGKSKVKKQKKDLYIQDSHYTRASIATDKTKGKYSSF